MLIVGDILYHAIRMKRIINAIRKSTNFDIAGVIGIYKRGKYTFVNIDLFAIKLWVENVREVEKYVHGNNAA